MKKLLFILSFASLTIIANAQWQQTILDSGTVDCFAVNGSNIFAGSEYYGVYLSSDAGKTWTTVNNGLYYNPVYGYIPITALAIKGDTVFAGAVNPSTGLCAVYLSEDNGASWSIEDNGLTIHPSSIRALAIKRDSIFAGTGRGVYLSSNNGGNWTVANSGLLDSSIYSLTISGTNIFAGTWSGIFLSANSAGNWTAVNTGIPINTGVQSLAVSGTNIFAGTFNIISHLGTGVYLSSNNGNSWVPVNTGFPDSANIKAFAISGTNIFAGTYGAGIYWSSNNGNSWTAVNTGLTDFYVNALVIIGDTIFAGTDSSGVWKRSINNITGIDETNNNENNIAVYPNPAKDKLTIKSLQKSTIEILNIQGQIILQQQIQQGKIDINISGLAKGVYILRLSSNDKTEVTRIVKE